ncbi:MAG TPA: hypothetical protein VLM76_15160 [Patescibacteria group bacterium]|nr:hypothetical protein [Patescibacteria group bacterium]
MNRAEADARAAAIRAVPHAAAEARAAAEEAEAWDTYMLALRAAEAVTDEEADHD